MALKFEIQNVLFVELCDNNRYGLNCSLKCICADNESCDNKTGVCSNGCADGWEGNACSKPLLSEANNEGMGLFSNFLIVGKLELL